MRRYILKRLLLMIPTLLGVAALVFFLLRVVPGDIVELKYAGAGVYAPKEAIAREYDWPRPSTEIVADPLPRAVKGTYQTEHGIVCEVTCERTRLMVSINKQPPAPFIRRKSDFISESVNASLQFLPSIDIATAVVLKQSDQSFRFER